MQILLNRSKFLVLVLLSLSLTSFVFSTNYNFFQIDGSLDNYDSSIITASENQNNISNTAPNQIDAPLSPVTNSSRTPIASVKQSTTIWSRLRSEFQMNHHLQSAQVQKEIRSIVADKAKLYHILQASAPYIYFINQQVQARKLPAELALIPVIESEFDPNDHSKKGASGLWQLMPQTARDLGVKVKNGYDGRKNVVKSTNAALAYFNDLQHLFHGNWELVLAAYNSGEGKVMHAEKRAGSKNFWDLQRLPKETKIYVPKLLAIAAIIQNPKKYGVNLPPVNNQPYFTEAKVSKTVNFSKIAKVTGINDKVLQGLNPDYRKGTLPNKGSIVLLPVANISEIRSRFGEDLLL